MGLHECTRRPAEQSVNTLHELDVQQKITVVSKRGLNCSYKIKKYIFSNRKTHSSNMTIH